MKTPVVPALFLGCLFGLPGAADVAFVNPQALFAEGANVTPDGMVYVELTADRLSRSVDGAHDVLWQGNGCFPAGAQALGGGFLVACNGGGSVVRLDAEFQVVWSAFTAADGTAFNQPNDITPDGGGGFWMTASGAPAPSQQPKGQVFYLTADGVAHLAADGLAYANGLAVSADGESLLVAEMFASRILAFPISGPMTLGAPSVWADLAASSPNTVGGRPPFPDGMALGPDGNLYVAIWGGQRIAVFAPDGTFLRDIGTPMLGTTNLAFGPSGEMLVTGVYDIDRAPFPGAVYLISE